MLARGSSPTLVTMSSAARDLLRQVGLRRRMRPSADEGAAAVEFALVLPVLALILFAIIDFGIFFANAISTNSGVAQATRQAVVVNWGKDCTPPNLTPSTSPHIRALMCMVADETSPLAGTTYVKVVLPDGTDGTPGWIVGKPLVVCAEVVPAGLSGYVPLPRNGVTRAKSVMTIEQDTGQPEAGGQSGPSGLDWSWCTS
jgi:Flp pilus assembly pilin Flp